MPGRRPLAAITGALAGPLLWAVAAVDGDDAAVRAAAVGVWSSAPSSAGSRHGWCCAREAVQARSDFRHALGAYLDVLVLLLAAQEGPEGAMDLAAQAGHGPAFGELRRAVWEAR